MKSAVMDKWITALTDGSYEQGTGHLREGQEYCCLGVLCDILQPSGWEEDTEYRLGVTEHYGKEDFPAREILEEAGIDTEDCQYLADMNDGGQSFHDIAEAIREEFERE